MFVEEVGVVDDGCGDCVEVYVICVGLLVGGSEV